MTYEEIKCPYFILPNEDPEFHLRKSLRQVGEILEYLYKVAECEFFHSWKGFRDIAPLTPANQTPEQFEIVNMTLVERTIEEAAEFYKLRVNRIVPVIRSKSFVVSLQDIFEITEQIRTIIELDDIAIQTAKEHIGIIRSNCATHIKLHIIYFMNTGMEMIAGHWKTKIGYDVSQLPEKDRYKFLLRSLTDLQNRKQFSSPKVYNDVEGYLQREVNFYNSINKDETMALLVTMVQTYLKKKEGIITSTTIIQHLATGDYAAFIETLKVYIQSVFSSHDLRGNEQEREYNIILTTILLKADEMFVITSNQEAGTGRYDILMTPRSEEFIPIIFELKRLADIKPQTVKQGIKDAFQQITDRGYADSLKMQGFEKYVSIAAAFHGKNVFMEFKETPIE